MFDNDYILVEKILDSSNAELQDCNLDGIFSRLYSDLLKKFMEGIPNHFAVDEPLHDNSSNGIYNILDSKKNNVEDHQSNNLFARYYSSELVLDSHGNSINCQAIFVN